MNVSFPPEVELYRYAPESLPVADFFKIPDDGQIYWQVMYDFQTDVWGKVPRPIALEYKKFSPPEERSLPATVPLKGPDAGEFTPLTEPFQVLWHGMIDYASEASHSFDALDEVWRNVTISGRALTDQHSRGQGFADYILGENIDGPPMAIKYLTMSGNMLRQKRRSGTKIYFETIDIRKPAPSVEWVMERPWLCHWATESTVIRYKYGYVVSRWHWNFHNDYKYGTPFPLVSHTGELWFDKSDPHNKGELRQLEPGEKISVYNPPEA